MQCAVSLAVSETRSALFCPPNLRCAQYDEDDLPIYEKSSSHLRARDAWLVERVTREFLAAYAQVRGCGGVGVGG